MDRGLENIVEKIIKEQELIIGPVAWEQAQKVSGLKVDLAQHTVVFDGNVDEKVVVDRLVAQYQKLFGRASLEVCKEAAHNFVASMSPAEVPSTLR